MSKLLRRTGCNRYSHVCRPDNYFGKISVLENVHAYLPAAHQLSCLVSPSVSCSYFHREMGFTGKLAGLIYHYLSAGATEIGECAFL